MDFVSSCEKIPIIGMKFLRQKSQKFRLCTEFSYYLALVTLENYNIPLTKKLAYIMSTDIMMSAFLPRRND